VIRPILATLLGLALLAPHGAMAQEDPAKERAKQLFIQGSQHYQAGRFEQALVAFEQANAIKPHPLMLYNIAQVQEAMGRAPEALTTWKKYLATSPEDRDEPEQRIAALEAELQRNWSTIQVVTDPPGATLWIGAKTEPPKGQSPLTVQLPAGSHTFILEKPGYSPASRPLRVEGGKSPQLRISLTPILPVVIVNTRPPGAKVSIDGDAGGPAPRQAALPPGKHTATITLDGFAETTREFELTGAHSANSPLTLEVELVQQAPMGQLEVSVDVDGAEILVDGEPRGRSPLPGPLPVSAGLHSIEVRAPGKDAHQEMVNISAGETTRTVVSVGGGGSGDGVSGQTWGWVLMGVGGAALVGGGVTGAMALSTSGDLDDCRSNPSCDRTQEEVDLANDVSSQALMTDVLVASGVGIAVTGLVVYLMSDDTDAAGQSSASAPTFGVLPTDGGGAVSGGVSF
jgi:hypothetical protein